ncbi:hypothetical protein LWI28_001785 [Acer negundo]|uniref:Uncharacterized protein n=1 Tax=Acer negundo TaxID=4023 RepID=A0AAD5NPF5_ACENE|nr:hypothetical protein LWI28_001785 [Acer negundo]
MAQRYRHSASTYDELDNPFVNQIAHTQFPERFRMPTIEQYKETRDPKEHVRLFRNVIAQYTSNDGPLCITFCQTFFDLASRWVPDDRSGWDWPEALSATVGLVNSSVSTPNMPSNSDLAKLVGSSRGLIKSGQHLDNIVFPKNARTGQSLVIDALHDKEQRYEVAHHSNLSSSSSPSLRLVIAVTGFSSNHCQLQQQTSLASRASITIFVVSICPLANLAPDRLERAIWPYSRRLEVNKLYDST